LLVKYAKDNEKVKIKIGSLNGEAIGLDRIVELSKLGSVNDVRARFIGVLNAPASKLVRVFDAFAKKDA
jgi:large subunit ribosomal protein L10